MNLVPHESHRVGESHEPSVRPGAAGAGANGYPDRVLRRLTASRAVRVSLALVAVGFCGYALVAEWDGVRTAAARLSWYVILGSLVTALAGLACMLMTWRTLLADLGSTLPLRPAARVVFLSQLGKYVPGSVWPFVVQMELAHEHDIPRRRSATAGLLAMIVTLAGALVLAAATMPLVSWGATRRFWPALAVAPLLVAGLHPAVLNPVLDRVLRLLRRPPLERHLSLGGTARAFGWALLEWLLFGAHAWLLVGGVGGRGATVVPAAMGAYALAWSVGFLFIIAPAGAGVREAALIAGLAPVLPAAGSALVVALVSRAVMTVGDLAWAGVGFLLGRGRPSSLPASAPAAAKPSPTRSPDGARDRE